MSGPPFLSLSIISYLVHIFALIPSFLIYSSVAYTPLSSSSLRSLPRPGSSFSISDSNSLLSPILVPRVSGTEGNERVRSYFASFFASNLPQWTITYQNSTSKTPATGDRDVPFINVIAQRAPPWAEEGETSYLTLVAHYDSKLTPTDFIGATDSAAPCAMLLHVAQTLDSAFSKKWERMTSEGADGSDPDANRGLQILLLDGEEAFRSWTKTDSIYGARSLAAEWEVTPHAALSTYRNPLDSIELFVLLDLLGASNPRVPSYFLTSHWAYQKMADTEARLRNAGLFQSSPNHKSKRDKDGGGERDKDKRASEPKWFFEAGKQDADRWLGGMIGDDHEPFLARGVEVLHVIPNPFPRVWHEMEDDGAHLDMEVTEDWAMLVAAFTAEWMELEGFLGGADGGKERSDRNEDGGRIEKREVVNREGKGEKSIKLGTGGVTVRDELLSDW